jgi:hypothetical protein
LGIGDWAQSPIPNPQSPIPISKIYFNLVNNKQNKIIFFNILNPKIKLYK